MNHQQFLGLSMVSLCSFALLAALQTLPTGVATIPLQDDHHGWNTETSSESYVEQEMELERELLEVGFNQTSGAEGYWSTKGNRIVDSAGNTVFFSGINWQGFEYVGCVVDGLQNRTLDSHLDQMVGLGFNLIRLAFAGTCIQKDVFPMEGSVNFTLNFNLFNKTSFEIFAEVVKGAKLRGMKIILGYHRLAPPYRYDFEPGLWYNATYNESYWINTWKMMVSEYVGDSTVIGADLFNEPHPMQYPFTPDESEAPYWLGDGRYEKPPLNWRTAAKRAANAILKINPQLLIFVQGMWQGGWYASNLIGVSDFPLKLSVKNKLVYTIHEYGPALRYQPWHNEPNFPAGEPDRWDGLFGFVHDEKIAPLWVGEFGSLFNHTPSNINGNESLWFNKFVDYIHNKSLVWAFFTWCPNAQNVGGILSQDDWLTPRYEKLDALKSIMYPTFTFQPPVAPPPSPPLSPPYPPAGPRVFFGPPNPPTVPLALSFISSSPPPMKGDAYRPCCSHGATSWLLLFCSLFIFVCMR